MSYKHIIGVFDDETLLLKAFRKLKENGVNIKDIYGPFADHDLMKAFAPESRLPYMAFIYGVMTIIGAFGFLYYTAVIDYPLNYGGKPYFNFPPFVVILFLLTILVTGGLSVFTFLGRTQLFPGKEAKMPDPKAMDDRFYLVLDQNFNPEDIKGWLKESGAEDILEKEIDF